MWKAAFSGRSEMSSQKKKSSGSVVSSTSRDERRKSGKSSRGSTYDDYDEGSAYYTAPSSRVGEPRGLTESAVNALSRDDEMDWEDEDKDARSERRSVKSGKSGRSERHRRRSERSRSREREKDRERTRKEEKRKGSSRRDSELSRGKSRSEDPYTKEGERAIPEMGSFQQFPGQYAGGMMGQAGQQDHMMSGGLSGGQPSAPNEQFGPTREDSFGAAASYYLDEGQSVLHQPGVRTNSPNMLVNPDHHLHAASLDAQPAADTGQGSAADFFNGDVVMTEEPQPINKPGQRPAPSSSSASRPSKPGRTSSLGTAAAATAALGVAGAAAVGSSSYHSHQHSSSMSNSYQQQSGSSLSGKPGRQPSGQISPGTNTPQYAQLSQQQGAKGSYYGPPPRQQSQGTPSKQSVNGTYYGTPTAQQSYGTPTRPGTDGSYYASSPGRQSEGKSGKHPSQQSNAGMYAAGAAAAGLAGYAAYEGSQQHKQKHSQSQYAQSQYGGTQYARPPGYAPSAAYTSGSYADMQQRGYHEHKGPITKLKDGFLNLLSTEEDVAKMEMYTEAIGVCKHCFDPRTSPWDAPRRHHYHSHSPRRDSFEDLRRRRSLDKMRKHGSREHLAGRVDKDSRYYASDSKRKSGSKADLAAAGLAGVGLAAGANALFNSGKDFEDTYSVKSGHRPSSAARRRSRSSSREQRRKSTHGVIGRDSKDEYAFVRTKDGRTERRRVHRSRSRSNDGRSSMMGAAAGAALGASAIAAGSSRRRHSRSRSRSSSPGLAGILGFSDSKTKRGRHSPDGSYYGASQRPGREEQQSSGMFGGFFTSPPPKRRNSKREYRKKKAGFFNFGNGSSSSSDGEMAFGDGFSSKTNLPLRRKSSNKNVKRKGSDQRIAATVAGIGATAAALAAAQKGNRISKRTSRPELGAKRRQSAQQDSSDEEWEDELPSDASSGSSLAFGDYAERLSRRQSKESMTSNGSGAGGLSAWGWRWGNKKEKKKRRVPSPPPAYPPRPGASVVAPAAAAGAAAIAAGAAARPSPYDSRGSSLSGASQQPMQYVDPRPVSEASSISGPSRMPGGFDFDEPPVIRPGPAPIQQPKPVAPIQPAFTDRTNEDLFNDRPKPRRTMSSPTQSSFGMKDAALIGAAAIGTASIIASQSGRRSKEPKDVRFGLTEEQQAKEEREKRKEREKVERNERARADRERALKEEAERFTREQDVLRRREEENRRAAEAQIERERKFEQDKRDREAERERKEREAEALRESERQEAYRQDEARKAEAVRRQDEARRKREAEIDAEIEARRRELEKEQRRVRERSERRDSQSGKTSERRDSQSEKKSERSSSIPWGAVAAGTAAAATAGAVYAGVEHEREKDRERRERDSYTAREIAPTKESPELADHDVFDPAFFKRKRSPNRSPSGDRQIEEIARKAYQKIRDEGVEDYDQMIAEKEDYYHEPQRSQVDVFAPKEILEREAGYKEHAPDPMGGNDVRYIRDSEGHIFDDELYGPKSFERSHHAPFGVPKLGLIAPTPPPEVRAKEKKRRDQSPLSKSEVGRQPEKEFDDDVRDTWSEPGGRKSTRSRSISWGEPQTHVYEPRTPESFRESAEGFFDAKDVGVGAAAATAAAAVGGAAVYASRDKNDDSRSPDARNGTREADDDVEEVIDITDEGDSGYRKPFFESVSDLGLGGFNVDSPGTEGAPPVRGFVEGEVDETPKEERGPHIPGGWDDEQKDGEYFDAEAAPSTDSRDVPSVVEEQAWEPPLSKKDKKKRDKAAKRASAFDEEVPSPPVVEPERVPENSAPVEEEIPYEMLSKKDKKKRDKAKRASTLEEEAMAPATPEPETIPEPTPPVEDEIPYEMLSKKEKKKRDKLKRGSLSEDIASPPPESEVERVVEPEPESTWEPPLSKKEQKKREKEAKKQGFADVAAAAMTTAGIAAVAGAATAEDDSEFWDSPSGKKGKKGKKAKAVERDIRDIEPTASEAMPGGWEAEKMTDSPPPGTVDPFQSQVQDDSPPATTPDVAREVDPMDEFADVKSSKKSKKKAKRDSLRFNEPEVSSPLRSEVAFDDYMGAGPAKSGAEMPSQSLTTNGHAEDVEPADEERTSRSTAYEVDDRPLTESPRRVSPDDLRSVASEPTGARERRRRSKSDHRPSEYYEEGETDPYDDVRSVAASEPADLYERRKSKRRSRTEDDDAMSTVSSRSTRREKEEECKKEKKGGFFGLFGRKSSSPPSKSDGASLSRTSTRDSKDGYDEDGERRHRRRKSEYGDDDDTRSVVSESRHRHHHRRRTDEEYPRATSESGSRPHHHRRRTEDDYYGSSGKDNARDQSFLGMRVEGMPPLPVDLPASPVSAPVKDDQGFGTSGPAERETVERGEPGKGEEGERVFQEPGETVQAVESLGEVEGGEEKRALRALEGEGALVAEEIERNEPTPGMVAAAQTTIPPVDEAVEYLPALPESPPDSPTEVQQPQTQTPQRPIPLQRPTSTTAVPLRFPFGQSPMTSGHGRMERAVSFGGHLPSTPPTQHHPSHVHKTRQGRPTSTEMMPLYLVERTRKTPEVEEMLPSLPSSKPSSRASSIVGSDEYESAVEEFNSPIRNRGLAIDTESANAGFAAAGEDYLDSQQTTPRASERPSDPFATAVAAKTPKQQPEYWTWMDLEREQQQQQPQQEEGGVPEKPQPQFYTWEDYERDEAWHRRQNDDAVSAPQPAEEELPALPPSRPQSRTEVKEESDSRDVAKGVAAAALAGGAAVLGYNALKDRDDPGEGKRDLPPDSPTTEIDTGKPLLARADSNSTKSKKKKGKKGKKQQQTFEDAKELPTEASAVAETAVPAELPSRDTDTFITSEKTMEEGDAAGQGESMREEYFPPPKPNALDRFLETEERLEEGNGAEQSGDLPEVATSDASLDAPAEIGRSTEDQTALLSSPTDAEFFEAEQHVEEGGWAQEAAPEDVEDDRTKSIAGAAAAGVAGLAAAAGLDAADSDETQLPTDVKDVTPAEADVQRETAVEVPATERFKDPEGGPAEIDPPYGAPSEQVQDAPIDDGYIGEATIMEPHLPTLEKQQSPPGHEQDLAAIPAPVEATTAVDVEAQPEGEFAPLLTRKQSKKSKKAQKKGGAKKALDDVLATDSMAESSGQETAIEDDATKTVDESVGVEDAQLAQPDEAPSAVPTIDRDIAEPGSINTAEPTPETPSAAPHPAEEWEERPALSRKQSKKQKKKQKQRFDVFGGDEPEVQSEERAMNSIAPANEATSSETAKSADVPVTSAEVVPEETPATFDHPQPESVPLPDVDDEELQGIDVQRQPDRSVPGDIAAPQPDDAPLEPAAAFEAPEDQQAFVPSSEQSDTTPREIDAAGNTASAGLQPISSQDMTSSAFDGHEPTEDAVVEKSPSETLAETLTETLAERPEVSRDVLEPSTELSSTTPAAETAQTPAAEPEDEFAWSTSSKKKGKKGKKSKKAVSQALPWDDEPTAVNEPSAASLEETSARPEDSAVRATDAGTRNFASEEPAIVQEPLELTQEPQATTDEPLSADAPRTEREGSTTVSEQNTESFRGVADSEDGPPPVQSEEIASARSSGEDNLVPEQSPAGENEDADNFWAPTTSKKKKGKKGKKAAGSLAPDAPIVEEPTVAAQDDKIEGAAQPTESDSKVDSELPQETAAPVSDATAAVADDFWAAPSSKKKKKGKKAARSVDDYSAMEQEPSAADTQVDVSNAEVNEDVLDPIEQPVEASRDIVEPSAAPDDENFWTPLPSKKKKGKKARQSGLSTPFEPAEASLPTMAEETAPSEQPEEPVSTPQLPSEDFAATEVLEDSSLPAPLAKDDTQAIEDSDPRSLDDQQQPDVSEVRAGPEDPAVSVPLPEGDDDLATPIETAEPDARPGVADDRSLAIPAETSEPPQLEAAVDEQAPPMPADTSESRQIGETGDEQPSSVPAEHSEDPTVTNPADEEEWALPSKKKKGKKGKKARPESEAVATESATLPVKSVEDSSVVPEEPVEIPSQTADPIEDEFWAPTTSKKKKGKKGKKSEPTPEPAISTEADVVHEGPLPADSTEPTSEQPSAVEDPRETTMPAPDAEADQFWPGFSKKEKGKKSKKGKKLEPEPAAERALEADTAVESQSYAEQNDGPQEPLTDPTDPTELISQPAAEEEFWPTTSKKNKKGKKGRSVQYEPPQDTSSGGEPNFDYPVATAEERSSVPAEPAAFDKEPSALMEGPSTLVEEPSTLVQEPSTLVEEPRAVDEETSEVRETPAAEEDDFWTAPTSKKKKKGKKGKAAEQDLIAEAAPTEDVTASLDDAASPVEDVLAPTEDAAAAIADPTDPATRDAAAGVDDVSVPIEETTAEADSSTMPLEAVTSGAPEEPSDEPAALNEENNGPHEQEPTVDAEDFWTAPTKKKKGKKGKKSQLVPEAEQPPTRELPAEDTADAIQPPPEVPAETVLAEAEPSADVEPDVWAVPSKKKKCKKGKKSGTQTPKTPTEAEGVSTPFDPSTESLQDAPTGDVLNPTGEAQNIFEPVSRDLPEESQPSELAGSAEPTTQRSLKEIGGEQMDEATTLSDIVDLPNGSPASGGEHIEAPSAPEISQIPADLPEPDAGVSEDVHHTGDLPSSVQRFVDADASAIADREHHIDDRELPAAVAPEPEDVQDLPTAVREFVETDAEAAAREPMEKAQSEYADPQAPAEDPATAASQPTEAEPMHPSEGTDDFWAAPSKKKKKGKKGKRDTQASEAPEKGIKLDEASAQVGDSEPMDVDTADTLQDLPTPTVTEEPAAEDPESFWTAPSKGKKGKKGKQAKRTTMEFDSLPEQESTSATQDASEVPTGSAETPVQFESQAQGSQEDAKNMDQMHVDEPYQDLPEELGSENQTQDLPTTTDNTAGEALETEDTLATTPRQAGEAVSEDTEAHQTENTNQTSSAALTGGLPSDNLQEAAQGPPDGEMQDQPDKPQTRSPEGAPDNTLLPEQEQATNDPAEDIDFGSFSKKSKKDKKKAKKAKSASADPWTEEASEAAPASSWDDNAALATAGALATGALGAGALAASQDASEKAPFETQEEEWPTFTTKKSKKDKRKAKKSGSATPADPLETEPRDLNSEPADLGTGIDTGATDAERAPLYTSAEEPVSEAVAHDMTTAEPAVKHEDLSSETLPTEQEADLLQDTPAVEREPDPSTAGQRDIDFAATVAAGLQDSGFDPDMVVNDPVFHRRATPPGGTGEADPEEVFESFSKKKKKKGKKGKQLESASDGPSRDVSGLQTPQSAANDFDEVLARSMEGTGVDPAALAESVPATVDPQSNELTGDGAEFSFATTRRKKGKKKARANADNDNVEVSDAAPDTFPINAANEEAQASDVRVDAPVEDANPAEIGGQDSIAAAEPQTELSRQLTVDTNTTEPTSALTTTPGTPLLDPAADLVHAGERDMDVDDMDKAYRAYKRNKRKQKKQKWAALQAEESASETPQFTEAATPATNAHDPAQTAREISTEAADAVSGQRERQSIEQADFVPTEETEARDLRASQQPVQSADGPGDYLHTSEVSQSLPIALDRTPSPAAESQSDANRGDGSRGRSLSGNEVAGLGAAAAAATAAAVGAGALLARSSSRHRDRSTHSPRLESKQSLGLLPNDDPSPWSFDGLRDEETAGAESPIVGAKEHQVIRDSGYQETSSPRLSRQSGDGSSRAIPEMRAPKSKESLHSRRSNEALYISTDTGPEWDLKTPKNRSGGASSDDARTLHARTPSQNTQDTPLESTSRNRASYLFQTTPENLRSASLEGATPTPSGASNAAGGYFPAEGDDYATGREDHASTSDRGAFSPPPSGMMSPRIPLDTIPEEHLAYKRSIGEIDTRGPDQKAVRRTETPQSIRARERALSPTGLPPLQTGSTSGRSVSNPGIDEIARTSDMRSPSVMSNRSNISGNHWKSPDELRSYSRTSNRSNTPSLRRTSLSGDLRAASRRGETGSAVGARSSPKTIPFEAPPTPPSQDDEVMDAGASRSVDMSDVYQGYGDAQGSQVSPTRPPSMRKRQSMHIMDLESRLEQLAAENQALQSAKEENGTSRGLEGQSLEEALRARDLEVQQKDNEIGQIRVMLQPMQEEIARLTEMNNGLTEANRNLVDDSNSRYATLQQEHAEAHEQWQTASRELDGLRQEHGQLTSGMRAAVEAQLASALASKNSEIRELREELDVATEKIRALQTQIQSTKGRDFLTVRDEDYFDGACQKLCQHVQQWVLRFSKVSDNRVCRLSTDLKDDKVEARLDNAILDGSDVDKLLGDRVRRRDVFMSVVMTMVWEYVFTRYLFGMDREQRQKLKTLEKLLSEVGPPRAVAQWRATTLTLLAKRPAFAEQRDRDEQAVASEVFDLLCRLLPPPSSNEEQLLSSLQRVMHIAVDLSIEMRTQRSEYIMLPPLLPEYDTNGDLMHKVHFNASLMNERSGMFSSNEELEQSRAVVKIVLFPLVVKKGDEVGEGEEEIVVCPAQVLVHNDNNRGKKVVRVESGHMTIDDPRRSRQSLVSGADSTAF